MHRLYVFLLENIILTINKTTTIPRPLKFKIKIYTYVYIMKSKIFLALQFKVIFAIVFLIVSTTHSIAMHWPETLNHAMHFFSFFQYSHYGKQQQGYEINKPLLPRGWKINEIKYHKGYNVNSNRDCQKVTHNAFLLFPGVDAKSLQ